MYLILYGNFMFSLTRGIQNFSTIFRALKVTIC